MNNTQEISCRICLDNVIHNKATLTVCRHVFHEECITCWFQTKNNCPLCKIIVNSYCNNDNIEIAVANTQVIIVLLNLMLHKKQIDNEI